VRVGAVKWLIFMKGEINDGEEEKVRTGRGRGGSTKLNMSLPALLPFGLFVFINLPFTSWSEHRAQWPCKGRIRSRPPWERKRETDRREDWRKG